LVGHAAREHSAAAHVPEGRHAACKIEHEDLKVYNAVQKLLYIVVILAGISQVASRACPRRRW
jgi:thiosulfate reductase cytochrome b subunit